MKIKDNFVIRTVAGQNVVAPVGTAALDFNAMKAGHFCGGHWKSPLQKSNLSRRCFWNMMFLRTLQRQMSRTLSKK